MKLVIPLTLILMNTCFPLMQKSIESIQRMTEAKGGWHCVFEAKCCFWTTFQVPSTPDSHCVGLFHWKALVMTMVKLYPELKVILHYVFGDGVQNWLTNLLLNFFFQLAKKVRHGWVDIVRQEKIFFLRNTFAFKAG